MVYKLSDLALPRDDPDSDLHRAWDWADLILDDRLEWDEEGAELLQRRSALEFGLAQLTDDERAKLAEADQLWRDNPQAFNAFFAYEHERKDRKTALDGWVTDEKGNTPAIPVGHWWWLPLETGND